MLCLLTILMLFKNLYATSETENQPNIIVMLMDDMGWGDLGVLGNPAMETKRLDELAEEGILLTDLYSANPLCSPSRAALLTGRLPIRNGFYTSSYHGHNGYTPQNIVDGISDEEILLPEVLSKAGYKTKLVGKWHLGHREKYLPLKHGFDEWFGAPNCHFGPYDDRKEPNIPVYNNSKMLGRYYEEFKINRKLYLSNMTKLYTNSALEYIERMATANKKFFLYWAPDSTHAPVYSSVEFKGKSIRGPYGDAVLELDDAVGKIVDLVKKLKIDENTIIFFTSDNGAACVDSAFQDGSNGPFLCAKQTTFEGGVRVPGIVWGPSFVKPNQVSDQPLSLMDIFTTSIKLAKASVPTDRAIDGVDLTKLLNGVTDKVNRTIFHYRGNELFAVRHGIYKAHYWTWTNSLDEFKRGITFCRGQYVESVTTHEQVNRTSSPILFHLGRDPGEKHPMNPTTSEYKLAMKLINYAVEKHKKNLLVGKPLLDFCDVSVMNWAPNGCEKLKKCLPIPDPDIIKCTWPH